MSQNTKIKIEFTKNELDYVAGIVELYRGKLQISPNKNTSQTIKKELQMASAIGAKLQAV